MIRSRRLIRSRRFVRSRRAGFPWTVSALLLVLCLGAGSGQAQIDGNTLSLADTTAWTGETIAVDLRLANEDAVGGVQVDVVFDPAVVAFQGVTAAERGSAMTAEAAIVSDGRARILMYFPDATALPTGDGVIANLSFLVQGQENETTGLVLENRSLANPEGAALPSTGEPGRVTVLAPENPPILHIAALKNPGQTRALNIFVTVTAGSGNAPTVLVGNDPVTMTVIGNGVFRGRHVVGGSPSSVNISARDTNSIGEGQDVLTLALP